MNKKKTPAKKTTKKTAKKTPKKVTIKADKDKDKEKEKRKIGKSVVIKLKKQKRIISHEPYIGPLAIEA